MWGNGVYNYISFNVLLYVNMSTCQQYVNNMSVLPQKETAKYILSDT
jgi:hypothetical protein